MLQPLEQRRLLSATGWDTQELPPANEAEAAEVGGWYPASTLAATSGEQPRWAWAAGEILIRPNNAYVWSQREPGEETVVAVLTRLFREYDLEYVETSYGSSTMLWRMPLEQSVPAVAGELSDHPAVVFAEPSYLVSTDPIEPGPYLLLEPGPHLLRLPHRKLDLNGDSEITPADALRAINHMAQPDAQYTPELDVNLDGAITPLDPLLVINHLSRNHERSVAIRQATEDLAQRLITRPQEIHPESVTEATWPDSHLGLGYGEAVAREVHGYRIMLRSGDDLFEYRAGNGTTVLNLDAIDLPPAEDAGWPRDRWTRDPGFDQNMNPIDETESIKAWEAAQVAAAVEDLARLLFVSGDAIDIVSVDPVQYGDSGRGIGRAGYLAVVVPGLRIKLSCQLDGSDQLYEYRAVDTPVLVLNNLPQTRS